MISRQCQLCEGDNAQPVKKEHNWNIVQCKNCGFVYVNPCPDEDYLRQYYQRYLPEDQHKIESWKHMISGVFLKSLDIIESVYKLTPGRLLDIGCGYGFFIQIAKERGWKASGIEISEKAVLYAKSKRLNVSNSDLFKMKYEEASFDLVTMFYLLEHLPDPVRYLREVYRIIKPKGLLLVRVPHTTPIVKLLRIFHIANRLYDTPSHLSDFSPQTLKLMLEKVGFRNIRTIIGGMTYPAPLAKSLTSCFFGRLATLLNVVTFGRYLLPGVSKTTIAEKKET